jgi:hypothetical protein
MKVKEFETILDKNGNERLRVRLEVDKGELKFVLFQYESFVDNHWLPIVRYDCSHDFFHHDILKPNGDKEKRVIEMENLKTAAKYAEQDLKDRWEWYREQYLKKMKRIEL